MVDYYGRHGADASSEDTPQRGRQPLKGTWRTQSVKKPGQVPSDFQEALSRCGYHRRMVRRYEKGSMVQEPN